MSAKAPIRILPRNMKKPKKLIRPKGAPSEPPYRSNIGASGNCRQITQHRMADFLWNCLQQHERGEISDQRLQAISAAAAQIRAVLNAEREQRERQSLIEGFGPNLTAGDRVLLYQMLSRTRRATR
jgi:hypothetical protein